jgi:hypothetical protein
VLQTGKLLEGLVPQNLLRLVRPRSLIDNPCGDGPYDFPAVSLAANGAKRGVYRPPGRPTTLRPPQELLNWLRRVKAVDSIEHWVDLPHDLHDPECNLDRVRHATLYVHDIPPPAMPTAFMNRQHFLPEP